jgi:hypothetical protein
VIHLFLHFEVAQELWSLVFCLFGVSLVMPYFVLEGRLWKEKQWGDLESRSFVFNVVSLERKNCSLL